MILLMSRLPGGYSKLSRPVTKRTCERVHRLLTYLLVVTWRHCDVPGSVRVPRAAVSRQRSRFLVVITVDRLITHSVGVFTARVTRVRTRGVPLGVRRTSTRRTRRLHHTTHGHTE